VSFWNYLSKPLRAGLVISILLVLVADASGFFLSFVAQKEVASNPVFGWGDAAWVFPLIVDVGLLGCEAAFLTLSMMAGTGLQQIGMAFLMLVFGGASVLINVLRVPIDDRYIAAAPPVIGILLTIVLATVLKALASHVGVSWQQAPAAPSAAYMLGPAGGPLHGAIYRPYPSTFPNGQIGPELGGNGVSKKRLVEQYLDEEVPPEDLRRITGREIAEVLSKRGVPMTAQTANAVLKDYRAAQRGR
jgi:hypothetical protein